MSKYGSKVRSLGAQKDKLMHSSVKVKESAGQARFEED